MSTAVDGQRRRHKFAPLGSGKANGSIKDREVLHLQGIIFDMDGTLCEPQNYMFADMRSAVGIPPEYDILDYIYTLPDKEQTEAFAKIQDIERLAMNSQVAQPGLVTLMEYLDRKGIKKAICTRNFDAPVTHFNQNHIPKNIKSFSPMITRDFRPPKPSPEPILHIAHTWRVNIPTDKALLPLVMVGDSIDDMTSGYEAGALTILLKSPGKEALEDDARTDIAIDRLDDIIDLLEQGLEPRIRK